MSQTAGELVARLRLRMMDGPIPRQMLPDSDCQAAATLITQQAATITALEARVGELEKEGVEAEKVCDSYALENQRLHDRAETAERALLKGSPDG